MPRRAVPADPSIGERIRTRRQLRRWSIRHAASRAGIAHTTWSRIEQGTLRTDRYMVADLAAALECSVADLTGQPHIPADRQLERAHTRVEPMWLALLEIAPDEPSDRVPLALSELASRMELLDAHRTRSDYAAVGQILPDLLRDLHASSHGPDGAAALRMLVDATTTARGVFRGLGYLAEATLAAERCRQAAEQLGEPVPLAVADWARANTAAGAGSHRRSLTLSLRAADELGGHMDNDGATAVLGMLHLMSALSTLRTNPGEAFAHLDESAALAERTGETRRWWMWFGPTNVGIWRMGAEVDAGDAGQAIEVSRRLHPGQLESAHRQATYYLELARAFADLDGAQDQQAERALLTAERLAPQPMRSDTAARETARFLLERSQRGSALRGMCERMGVA